MANAESRSRLVAGLMSGTSLDGIDVAIANVSGSGDDLCLEQVAHLAVPYDASLHRLLHEAATADRFSVEALSQLNVRLAYAYAEAVRSAASSAGISEDTIDLAGCHGQTVRHVPDATRCAGLDVRSTLQIGDPSTLANLLGIPVVGDFRLADIAVGGQGAPLVPYFDHVIFADEAETRGLLNLGGIANLTVLPSGRDPARVYAFDTGPANMLIDALASRFLGAPFDKSGAAAARGFVDSVLLTRALQDRYFQKTPPKSTGREHFGDKFLRKFLGWGRDASPEDLLATVTELTAASVFDACSRYVCDRLDVLIISGGGSRNGHLVARLAHYFHPVPVRSTVEYGIDATAKEALCMAVLAHETMNAVPTGMPAVTGAARAAVLGKICLPA